MKYTRYDYKRKKSDNFLMWIALIIVLSIFIGMSIYNLFIGKDGSVSENVNKGDMNKSDVIKEKASTESNDKEFGIIQCGVFNKKENADSTMNTIPNEYTKLIVEDSGNFKVIAGIYDLKMSNDTSAKLNESSVSNFRITCKINADTESKKIESEIIEGYLKIINKLNERDVKSINTIKFKEWVNENVNSIQNKDEELQSLIDNVVALPDEVEKAQINNSMILLYNILIKYKEK